MKARTFGRSYLAADGMILEPAVVFRYQVGGGFVDGTVEGTATTVLLSKTKENQYSNFNLFENSNRYINITVYE